MSQSQVFPGQPGWLNACIQSENEKCKISEDVVKCKANAKDGCSVLDTLTRKYNREQSDRRRFEKECATAGDIDRCIEIKMRN